MPGSTSAARLTLLRVDGMVQVASRRRLGSHAPAAVFWENSKRYSRSGRRKGTDDDGLGAGSEAKIRTLGRKGGAGMYGNAARPDFSYFFMYLQPAPAGVMICKAAQQLLLIWNLAELALGLW